LAHSWGAAAPAMASLSNFASLSKRESYLVCVIVLTYLSVSVWLGIRALETYHDGLQNPAVSLSEGKFKDGVFGLVNFSVINLTMPWGDEPSFTTLNLTFGWPDRFEQQPLYLDYSTPIKRIGDVKFAIVELPLHIIFNTTSGFSSVGGAIKEGMQCYTENIGGYFYRDCPPKMSALRATYTTGNGPWSTTGRLGRFMIVPGQIDEGEFRKALQYYTDSEAFQSPWQRGIQCGPIAYLDEVMTSFFPGGAIVSELGAAQVKFMAQDVTLANGSSHREISVSAVSNSYLQSNYDVTTTFTAVPTLSIKKYAAPSRTLLFLTWVNTLHSMLGCLFFLLKSTPSVPYYFMWSKWQTLYKQRLYSSAQQATIELRSAATSFSD